MLNFKRCYPQPSLPGKPSQQRGLAAVEFAIIGFVFFTLLFGVLEGGRYLFTLNYLDEVTRRGARLAAVCPVTPAGIADIRQRAIMDSSVTAEVPANAVIVDYLDDNGASVGNPVANFSDILYVQVSIDNNVYQFQALFPYNLIIGPVIRPPRFQTTLPGESLGIAPPGSTPGGNITC